MSGNQPPPNSSPEDVQADNEALDVRQPTRPTGNRVSRWFSRHRRVHKFLKIVWNIIFYIWFLIGVGFTLAQLYDYVTEKNQRRKLGTLKYRVLVPLQATNKEYLDYMQLEHRVYYDQAVDSPFSSKVAQNIHDSVKAAVETWFTEPNNSEGRRLDKSKIDFYFFPEGYDKDSQTRAFEKALVEAELMDRQIVALIGNASSSSTLRYAEFCGSDDWKLSPENIELLNREKPSLIPLKARLFPRKTLSVKIPMILPLATATSLTHNLRVLGVPSFLRLLPANDRQANFIASLLLEAPPPHAMKTIVIKDLSNKVYSEDLVEGFRENYVQHPLAKFQADRAEHPKQTFADKFGRILSVVSVGGEYGEFTAPFLYPELSALKPDALVIFGMTNTSLETLAQAKAAKLNFRYVILTDGAVDEYLEPRIASLVEPSQLKNIYLTFPLPCAMPAALDSILAKVLGDKSRSNFELTHSLYVADSVFVVLSLVDKGLQSPDVEPAKEFINKSITSWKEAANNASGKSVELRFPYSDREYRIDRFGNTLNIDYHLFHLEAQKQPTSKTGLPPDFDWKHSASCPSAMHKKDQDKKVQCIGED